MGRALLAASAAALAQSLLLASCTAGDDPSPGARAAPSTPPTSRLSPSAATPSTQTPSGPALPQGNPSPRPAGAFDAAAAMADVRLLAGRIGPRLATGPAYRRAGRWAERRFSSLGYDVRREVFGVPGGDSWGVPVDGGRSFNVVAEPSGFDASRPHMVLGAHLDTVAGAPGAEDNASGVAVLLEVARLVAGSPTSTRVPVVLIAFGAEEPRGPGDELHHFGSRHHVASMSRARRDALTAMVSLDRVGVGSVVPVCTGPLSPPRVQRALLRTAARIDVPAEACENTASDHWSFEKAGFAVARLGSTGYAAYHSRGDVPSVVDQRQLGRTGRLVWAWLR
ncbi:MAG TPA: M28 family metallopeptidase [Nocardioidaceae bacterium]|nr:M28 family metallopeptidase [Nocardioidaceae bacterium]